MSELKPLRISMPVLFLCRKSEGKSLVTVRIHFGGAQASASWAKAWLQTVFEKRHTERVKPNHVKDPGLPAASAPLSVTFYKI